jgi:hypothetical protein
METQELLNKVNSQLGLSLSWEEFFALRAEGKIMLMDEGFGIELHYDNQVFKM